MSEDATFAVVRADNPGPLTLSGTNTYLVGRDPCWIVDPGPALPEHVDAILRAAQRRGGAGGVVLTHEHADHAGAVPELAQRAGLERTVVRDGERAGPLTAVATPGHTPGHLAYVADRAAFTGDAVLGEGSVFIAGQLGAYLDALRRLAAMDLRVIGPGHGPLVEDPAARLAAYVEHRLDRERRLVAALDAGRRTVDELLDEAWDDAPEILRPAAAVTLAAHLDKLEEEGRLPEGVERPYVPAELIGP